MRMLVKDIQRDVTSEVIVQGEGPDVVLVPSALRGAEDFAMLQEALAEAGFRSIAINMRGAGQSRGPEGDLTLRDLANDVACVIGELCDGPVHIVGHALGNVIARATASYRPDVVRSVTVMPCGGHDLADYPVSDEVIASMGRCHDETLSDEERCQALRIAFFAEGNDPACWLEGWWPSSAQVSAAAIAADPAEWWEAGSAPILILQPLEDAMSPAQSGRNSAKALGARASYVEIPHCGHAILPEQPKLVADSIVQFLLSQEQLA